MAVEVTRALQVVINQPLSSETTRRHLKKAGMKAVVKKKSPFSLPGIRGRELTLHWHTRTGRGWCGQMRQKSTG